MVHSSKGDVERFEELISEYSLEIERKKSSKRFNLDWHFYDIIIADNSQGGTVK